ncbi:MAG: GIY-YIG nuclease family protein [Litorimonas sp.]
MFYVYILRSKSHPNEIYVGYTADLRKRLKAHNAGQVTHTSKYTPWAIQTYMAFGDRSKALAFERYLKSGSGRAFASKRL